MLDPCRMVELIILHLVYAKSTDTFIFNTVLTEAIQKIKTSKLMSLYNNDNLKCKTQNMAFYYMLEERNLNK
jgi:hypothetical protein